MPNDVRGFFSVGAATWAAACGQGMRPAVAFLTLARGTGRDNVTTSWSANAAEQYAGLAWRRANEAIKTLKKAGLIKVVKAGGRPRYKLQRNGPPIWLPNEIVTGAADEVPPLAKLRETQDVMALRLFVDLYREHHLREDGGIAREVTHKKFRRTRVGERGPHVVWGFDHEEQFVVWRSDVTKAHHREVTAEEKKLGRNAGHDFFERWHHLEALGLVEWVPYLFDGLDGEPIHPLGDNDDRVAAVTAAAREAGEALLSEVQVSQSSVHAFLVPVPKHFAQIQVMAIGRLRYRPHTKATRAWLADYADRISGACRRYRDIAQTATPAVRAA